MSKRKKDCCNAASTQTFPRKASQLLESRWWDISFLLGFLPGQLVVCTRNLSKTVEEFLFLAFFLPPHQFHSQLFPTQLLPPSSWQKASRVLFYHFSLGAHRALPGTGSAAHHFSLHWNYRKEKHSLTTTAILTTTTCVLKHDQTTGCVHMTREGHSGSTWKLEMQLCHVLPDVILLHSLS